MPLCMPLGTSEDVVHIRVFPHLNDTQYVVTERQFIHMVQEHLKLNIIKFEKVRLQCFSKQEEQIVVP